MVLPAPPPDDAPREGAWLDAILRELKLSGEDRGLLILVDHARPERLRDLVLALLPTYPDVEVYTDVRAVYEVPEGAVMILAPRAEDADWLNQQRPVFARRKLRVILWCDAETSVALAQKAVDFFDWVSHRHECPPGVPMHAVFGIRAALCARAPGIGWRGKNLDACFRAALPGRRLVHLSARMRPTELVQATSSVGRAWIVWHDVDDSFDMMWPELALKELHIKTRVFWTGAAVPVGDEWLIDERSENLFAARKALAGLGVRAPGRLAALIGLEREALVSIEIGLRRGVSETDIASAAQSAADPGAAVLHLISEGGLWPMGYTDWRPLLWRGLRLRAPWGQDWVMLARSAHQRKAEAWATYFAARDALQREDRTDAGIWAYASLRFALIGPGELSVEHANALRAFSAVQARQGDLRAAVALLLQALHVAEIRLGPDDPFLGGLYGDLAEVLAQKGDFDEAKRLAERAFQIEKNIPSLSSPYMGRAYKRFAYIQSLEDAAAAQAQRGARGSE